ncbi:MAG: hypothetical protein IKE81_03795 [Clostridia bacterium]|nr:hypothetical protein [Clostridia bacterium]
MHETYNALAEDLKAIGIPCAENDWNTRPRAPYITYALEFPAETLYADDQKVLEAWEGSIDLYATGKYGSGYAEMIEAALNRHCDGCWRRETNGRWDRETNEFHFEWVFQTED